MAFTHTLHTVNRSFRGVALFLRLRGMRLMIVVWLLAVAIPLIPAWQVASQQMRVEAALSRDRMAVYDLTEALRSSRARAMAQRQSREARFDLERGVVYLSALPKDKRTYAALEQAIWLPQQLVIAEAPSGVTAFADGSMTAASVIIVSQANRRVFRLQTHANGVVELHEEPTL